MRTGKRSEKDLDHLRGKNLDTAELLRKTLKRLSPKSTVVLALIPSSKPEKPPYKISLTGANVVMCECDGFKYRSECSHMERFRTEHVVQTFKRR